MNETVAEWCRYNQNFLHKQKIDIQKDDYLNRFKTENVENNRRTQIINRRTPKTQKQLVIKYRFK